MEASSVNRKQSEIVLSLPGELEPLEPKVREEINRFVARGRLSAKVVLHAGEDEASAKVRVNLPLARVYAREAARLAKELKLTGGLSVDVLLRLPGVIEDVAPSEETEELWPTLGSPCGRRWRPS